MTPQTKTCENALKIFLVLDQKLKQTLNDATAETVSPELNNGEREEICTRKKKIAAREIRRLDQ